MTCGRVFGPPGGNQNVGGLLPNMKLKLIEPLRELFKGATRGAGDMDVKGGGQPTRAMRALGEPPADEVRHLGELLGLDEASVWRHPFPGPGLAIRILGEGNVSDEHAAVAPEDTR